MSSIISTSELNSIIATVRNVVGDGTFGTSINYLKYSGTSAALWHPTVGDISGIFTISSVSAFKGGYKPDEVAISNGQIAITDVKFIIMRDDVSGVLSVNDKISESSSNYQSATTYEIKSVGRDPLAICYFIQARAI